jgi:hypothetical protein
MKFLTDRVPKMDDVIVQDVKRARSRRTHVFFKDDLTFRSTTRNARFPLTVHIDDCSEPKTKQHTNCGLIGIRSDGNESPYIASMFEDFGKQHLMSCPTYPIMAITSRNNAANLRCTPANHSAYRTDAFIIQIYEIAELAHAVRSAYQHLSHIALGVGFRVTNAFIQSVTFDK